MSEIKRYDITVAGVLYQYEEGQFVKYADHETALSEARREVEAYKEVEDSLQKEIKRLDGEVEELKDSLLYEKTHSAASDFCSNEWKNDHDKLLKTIEEKNKEIHNKLMRICDLLVAGKLAENRAVKAEAERDEAVKALREIVANHTLNGVVATMFCQGCIDDFETAQEALLAAKEVEGNGEGGKVV